MNYSNFNLYSEPVAFQWLVFIFNTIVYGGLIFSALHILRLAIFDKMKIVVSNWTILGITTIAVLFNIYLKIYLEIWGFIALFLFVAWASWRWIDRKSLRWTNISLAIFFLFTLGMYNLFNTKLQTITYTFFSFNDIIEYAFNYKPYFEIYLPGQFLAQTTIVIDGTTLLREADPVHYRLYLFYYFMQTTAIIFWLLIFFDVLKKHMFFYSKQVSKLKAYTFFFAPENFKWSDFKNKNSREEYLKDKAIENKKIKDGELVVVAVPKNSKKNERNKVNTHEAKEDTVVKGETIVNNNSKNSENLIDKTAKNINLIQETETSVDEKEKDNDMDIERVKRELVQQAQDMQEKARQLLEVANNLGKEEDNKALEEINKLHENLVANPVFSSITTIQQLRKFMEWHVFAVWDFMSLTKRLQIDLTCVTLPWMPPKNNNAANLINSIVWGEETDKSLVKGVTASHFELYLQAMKEIGADTTQIDHFMTLVGNGMEYREALKKVNAPLAVQEFTTNTIQMSLHGSTEEVLGYFFFGRENVIPEMFSQLLKDWKIDKNKAPTFVYYLERHIELDADEHGPAAKKMIADLCPTDAAKAKVYLAAKEAILSRISLWNNLQTELKKV